MEHMSNSKTKGSSSKTYSPQSFLQLSVQPPPTDAKKCPRCNKEFTNWRNLRTHVDICVNGIRKALVCHICDKRYSHQTTLIKHRKDCEEKAMAECGAQYSRELNLTLIDRGRFEAIKKKKKEMRNTFFNYFDNNYVREPKHYVLYVLIDPRTLLKTGSVMEKWQSFIASIFYVGKELAFRPLTHFAPAIDALQSNESNFDDPEDEESEKIKRIVEIWQSGRGVVMQQFCWFVGINEAQTIVACMIEAIGLHNLLNKEKGAMYGPPAGGEWDDAAINKFGIQQLHSIHRAMKEYVTELNAEDVMDVVEVIEVEE